MNAKKRVSVAVMTTQQSVWLTVRTRRVFDIWPFWVFAVSTANPHSHPVAANASR